jgi:hypothetical protein
LAEEVKTICVVRPRDCPVMDELVIAVDVSVADGVVRCGVPQNVVTALHAKLYF